jgi:flavin reductase (DIM6/NTAB) family NADH-FMN oxidoreductase RutF
MMDGTRFRRTMGHFVTGVAVATTRLPDGTLTGLTCNSLTSVSLDPPLVLFCVDHAATSRAAFLEAGHFALSLLAREDVEISDRFALGDPDLRFEGLAFRTEATGAPILDGALAWLDCTLWKTIEAGDHTVIIGRVETAGFREDADPLLYFRGRYGTLAP